MLRRNLLVGLPLAVSVGCAAVPSGNNTVSLSTVQSYADDIINALSAAAEVYVAEPGATSVALVNQLVQYLQESKTAIDALQSESGGGQSIALQIVGFAQQLSPIVMPFLGAAAPYIPLGIAVLQAFIASLPAPPAAPPQPPAELHRAALKYQAK